MASRHRFGRAGASSRSPRRTSREWRLGFGVDGCVLGFELAASGLDDSPLRYKFQWMCGHSVAVATHRAKTLDGRSFRKKTRSRSHDVRKRRGPLSVGERSGQLRPYVRPVARRVPLAIMGVRVRVRHQSVWRARGSRLLTVLPDFDCKVFPITLFQRFLPDQSGLRPPPPTNLRRDVTPQRPLRP